MKYRIIISDFASLRYQCQKKNWWWPFWTALREVGTHGGRFITKDDAIMALHSHILGGGKVIWTSRGRINFD